MFRKKTTQDFMEEHYCRQQKRAYENSVEGLRFAYNSFSSKILHEKLSAFRELLENKTPSPYITNYENHIEAIKNVLRGRIDA